MPTKKLPTITAYKAEETIAGLKEFKSNGNLKAQYDEDGTYCIYSYTTVVAKVFKGGKVWLNPQRYSQTTSRHMGYIKRGLRKATPTLVNESGVAYEPVDIHGDEVTA
jgi:hypothetical protein